MQIAAGGAALGRSGREREPGLIVSGESQRSGVDVRPDIRHAEDAAESEHAVTIARGVPGVDTVINRIALGDEERRFDDAARRARAGDPALTETHWEGRTVGTGRRRQGTSDEPDRHAGPKTELQDRWLQVDDAVRNAADETSGLGERRAGVKRSVRGDRTGGAPVAPSGVPKADHVAQPESEA